MTNEQMLPEVVQLVIESQKIVGLLLKEMQRLREENEGLRSEVDIINNAYRHMAERHDQLQSRTISTAFRASKRGHSPDL